MLPLVSAPLVAIVDDDESLRRSLDNLLSSARYRVVQFPSAEAFLAVPVDPDLRCAIVDVRMGPMSGIDLLAELGRRGVRTPVIVLTAFGDVELNRRATANGARAFMTKPFQPAALLAAVSAAIAAG